MESVVDAAGLGIGSLEAEVAAVDSVDAAGPGIEVAETPVPEAEVVVEGHFDVGTEWPAAGPGAELEAGSEEGEVRFDMQDSDSVVETAAQNSAAVSVEPNIPPPLVAAPEPAMEPAQTAAEGNYSGEGLMAARDNSRRRRPR